MKRSSAAAIAGAAALANAQSVSLSMTTWTECSTSGGPLTTLAPTYISGTGTVTDTATITSPYCPYCIEPHTTVYTTVYPIICPTGLSSSSYVVTETYTDSAPPAGPTYVPQGFTTGVHTCTVCGPQALTVTLTYPVTVGPTNAPAGPTYVPVSQISDGQPQAPAGTPMPAPPGGGYPPAAGPSGPAAPPAEAKTYTPQGSAPTPAPGAERCDGNCAGEGVSVPGNSSTSPPYTGAASSNTVLAGSALFAALVGVAAYLL